MGSPQGQGNFTNRAGAAGASTGRAGPRIACLAIVFLLAQTLWACGPAGATEKPMPPSGGAQVPAAPGISSVPMVPTPPQAKEGFTRFQHYDLSAGDEWESRVYGATACEANCQDNQECDGYTYDSWNDRCFLKRDLGELRLNPRAASGVLASQPQPAKSSATVVMKYYNNRAFPGGPNLTKPARNRDECERLCWGDNSCIGFSFYRDQRLCYLYNDPKVYGEMAGVFSGAKEQPAK